MTELAIDRFRSTRLANELEARAEANAKHLLNDPHLLLGYLEASVAVALEKPWWSVGARRRLKVDLRTIEMARNKVNR